MGEPGFVGSRGPVGGKGERGPPGERRIPLPGPKGDKGQPGLEGESGPPGPTGSDGAQGSPGEKGDLGLHGDRALTGLNGPAGPKGTRGPKGLPGLNGLLGPSGADGEPGDEGFPGAILPTGHMLVMHSQSTQIPQCPQGSAKLWEGYSLLYLEGNEKAHSQDLGWPGSCLQRFNTMPFIFCDFNEVCNYASRNDKSHWLSTTAPIPMMPVEGQDIIQYISRCAVCDVPGIAIAIHSQTTEIPECPERWEGLWIGYSFAMHTAAGADGGGQSLSSPGSCLEDFRSSPFIECNGARGSCHYFFNKFSFWLASINQRLQFNTPESETLKAGNLRSRISRCQVCMKTVS